MGCSLGKASELVGEEEKSYLSPSVALQTLMKQPNLENLPKGGKETFHQEGVHHLRNVFAKPLEDFTRYEAPVFLKSEEEKEFLDNTLRKSYLFENMRSAQIFPLVQAFEKYQACIGTFIIQQGDKGDYFYVLFKGECEYSVSGKIVGMAHEGESFGELALLFDAPRAASVRASSDCTLFRVSQQVFRHILQDQAQSREQSKLELLEKVPFLVDLAHEEKSKLAAVMTPIVFHKDDVLMKKGDKAESFWLIQEGKIKLTNVGKDNIRYEDTTIGAGDYFGEAAIVMKIDRFYDATAVTDGIAFVIDTSTFIRVLGDLTGLIERSMDRKKLGMIKVFQDTNLDVPTLTSLSKYIEDRRYRTGTQILVEGDEAEAALYLVRKGKVRIFTKDGTRDETISVGGYFGEDQLLADVVRAKNCPGEPTTIQLRYSVIVVEECICGLLTLAVCRKCMDTSHMGKPHVSIVDSIVNRPMKLEELQKHRILGAGTFGQVWLVSRVTSNEDQRVYALKVQSKYELVEAGQAKAVVHEKNILAQLSSPFIVNLITTYKDQHFVYMLMELVQGGELHGMMGSGRRDVTLEDRTRFYGAGVGEGLAYMHRRGIVYRDLKPENVLIDSTGYPKIVDFGFAKFVVYQTYTLCGTPLYLAPEVILNRGHNWAADNWSYGVLLYEMICGKTPFYRRGMDQRELFKAIVRGKYSIPPYMSSSAADLIQGLLTKDPNHRLGSLAGGESDVQNHNFFGSIDREQLRRRATPAPFVPKITNPLDASNFEDWSQLADLSKVSFPLLSREDEEIFHKF